MENSNIFLKFSQIVVHSNTKWTSNGELLLIITGLAPRSFSIPCPGFSVMLLCNHLPFFAKTWLPRFSFLRVCLQFLSIHCLLYAKILEICLNRLYTSLSRVLYVDFIHCLYFQYVKNVHCTNVETLYHYTTQPD